MRQTPPVPWRNSDGGGTRGVRRGQWPDADTPAQTAHQGKRLEREVMAGAVPVLFANGAAVCKFLPQFPLL